MLRAMGVPARYVEGYAIGPGEASQTIQQDQNVTAFSSFGISQESMQVMEISVKDYNAHAWVETYID
jgi:transglutaminase-like putative cysteine protease